MKSERMELRITPEWLLRVDDWRRQQPQIPTRNEAVRRLVELGLEAAKQGWRPKQTDGIEVASSQS